MCTVPFRSQYRLYTTLAEKSAQRCRHCALAVVSRSQNFFSPAADPLPQGAGRPKCNQLETVTTFSYKPSLVRIDASSYRDNTPTHTHTNPQTGPITIHCATASLAHSVITMFYLSHSLCNLQGEYANICQEFFFNAATSTIQTICMCITQQ